MAIDTPRTDAYARHWPSETECVPSTIARQLERELAEAKAEVERLNHQLLKTESDLLQSQDINSFLDTEFRIACKRAEKAEAEVERLTKKLSITEDELADAREWLNERYKATSEADERR